jgi:hypothetical protein
LGFGAVAALAVEAAEHAHLLDYVWHHLPDLALLLHSLPHLPAMVFVGAGLAWSVFVRRRSYAGEIGRSGHAISVVVRERTTVTTTMTVERELVVSKDG